jgi:hypothetical protein
MVVRGSLRVVSATAARLRPIVADELAHSGLAVWRSPRGKLADRQKTRTMGGRFRQSPEVYLRSLE